MYESKTLVMLCSFLIQLDIKIPTLLSHIAFHLRHISFVQLLDNRLCVSAAHVLWSGGLSLAMPAS